MKAKTIYTDEYGEVVSCDDFDILQRSHDDLLEALEEYISVSDDTVAFEYPEIFKRATDAIKKARGI